MQPVLGELREFNKDGWSDDERFKSAMDRVKAIMDANIEVAFDVASLYKVLCLGSGWFVSLGEPCHLHPRCKSLCLHFASAETIPRPD